MITARYHREIPQRFRLEAGTCEGCGATLFPPRPVCPHCKGRTFRTTTLPGTGKVITYTVVRVGADKFSKETPFPVAIVELDNGVRLTAQIADAGGESVRIGQRVRLVFRRIQEDGKAGILCYGYKAVLE